MNFIKAVFGKVGGAIVSLLGGLREVFGQFLTIEFWKNLTKIVVQESVFAFVERFGHTMARQAAVNNPRGATASAGPVYSTIYEKGPAPSSPQAAAAQAAYDEMAKKMYGDNFHMYKAEMAKRDALARSGAINSTPNNSVLERFGF